MKRDNGRAQRDPKALRQAREGAMERMRARLDEPEPVVLPEALPEEAIEAAGAPDPLAALAVDLPATAEVAPAANGEGTTDAATSVADALKDDSLDLDLLDIFRDAKKETEEGSLAAEVEDIAIGDLLSDLVGIGGELGVSLKAAAPEPDPETEVEVVAEAEESPEEPAEPAGTFSVELSDPVLDETKDAAETDDWEDEVEAVVDDRETNEETAHVAGAPASAEEVLEMHSVSAATDAIEDGEPENESLEVSGTAEEAEPEVALPSHGAGRGTRYLLHVLFLGLAFAAAAGAGLRTAHNSGALAATAPQPMQPAILAYLRPPVVLPEAPDERAEDNQERQYMMRMRLSPKRALEPTPAPTPTAAPTPPPDPRQYGFQPGQAAYVVYEVRSGDDLASIGKTFGICPDHILWSNPGRGIGDALRVGDELVLPGYPGVVYTTRKGETLANIAARYSTEVGMIVAYPGNKLKTAGDFRPGQTLLLPRAIPPEAFKQSEAARWAYTNPSEYGYIWPFYGPITTFFGEQRPGYVHNAIDIGGLSQFGTPVLSVAAGRVEEVESGDEGYSSEGYGNHVIIAHKDGSRSLYAHLTKTYVEEGQDVDQGRPVGALGCTGHSTGTHLHFELYRDGVAVDPLRYLPHRS